MMVLLVQRRWLLLRFLAVAAYFTASSCGPWSIEAFSTTPNLKEQVASRPYVVGEETSQTQTNVVAFKEFVMPLKEFGVQVPVSCWFPAGATVADNNSNNNNNNNKSNGQTATTAPPLYKYRISVRRIGQLLAQWNFIPGLVARDFDLRPSRPGIVDGRDLALPSQAPVILLAHGYLGSRFDLSHLAEALAGEGFLCLSTEYPESLAASYDRVDGLDRTIITENMLQFLENNLRVQSTRFGIIGHSLGCLTVLKTGNEDWARVMIAGMPRQRDGSSIPGNILFVCSMNDGVMQLSKFGGAEGCFPKDVIMLGVRDTASTLTSAATTTTTTTTTTAAAAALLPRRAGLLLDRPNAPNHISFLSESVNDAMIDFLSALLPVARAFDIPLLDFDRYQLSRDSQTTAQLVHPLIIQYMKQEMKMNTIM